jgi:hypothetical protein
MKYWSGPRYSICDVPNYYREFFYLIERKTNSKIALATILNKCELTYTHRESRKYFIHSFGHSQASYELGTTDAQLIGLKYEAPFMKMLWYFHEKLNLEYEIWVKPDYEIAEDYLEYDSNSPTNFNFTDCENTLKPLEWQLNENKGITLGYFVFI